MNQTVSYLWREPAAPKPFTAGVSLHSHTNQSRETLDFIAELSTDWRLLQPLMRWMENRAARCSGILPDYARAYWTPPLTPSLAYDLERGQIEDRLQIEAMVSLTDHDDIRAPLLLRSLESARRIPVSVEWSVPFHETTFHIGIHNLPSATGAHWMARFTAFTALPDAGSPSPAQARPAPLLPNLLSDLFAELDALPGVLIIFNHPLWDLYRVGPERHRVLVNQFLVLYGQFIHALELNGLRHWNENREVHTLAERWNQLLISGGDRHGIEPNANVNLTRATSFTEFVHEIRRDRESHVLFMPQYAEPWKHRILNSTLDAIRDYPDFPEGSRRWDERVFHPDSTGSDIRLSDLWPEQHPPVYISFLMNAVRMMGAAPVSGGLRLAWNDSGDMRTALAKPTD